MLGSLSLFEKTVLTPLAAAGQLPDLIRAARSDSLIEYGRVTRVEPVTMVDTSIMHLQFMPDIMQSLNSIFTGYYLQAIMLSLNVGQVDTIKLLDRVNPNRDPIDSGSMFIGDMLSAESYKHALPRVNKAFGLEAYGDRPTPSAAGAGKGSQDVSRVINEAANLSVGKMIEIHVENEGHKAMIPASVRLIVSGIDPNTLIHILADGSKDKSLKERFHGWRSGQLGYWRDLILCQDLIDDHRKTLMKDKSGVYAASRERRNKNRLSAIFSMKPSVATASNLVVMSDANAKEMEREVGGRLKDYRTRQRIFESTYVMLMVVVDPAWEQVTIYHRGIELPTELSVREIKSANRGSGPDVSEILKAYQLGQAPTI
jgi:hypothetical protein